MFAFRFTALFLALIVDRLVGDPDWLWRRFPHPVVWFGNAIGFMDKRFNDPARSSGQARLRGVSAIVSLLVVSFFLAYLLGSIFWFLGLAGLVLEVIAASTLLAQKSLADHVGAVADALEGEGLDEGRKAVSMIVGRDPSVLDEAAVSRAAVESLAENFSDGIVAPVFWYVVGGLPGLVAYKMLNTADSMIGHKNQKYLHFGWASARLDDFANWIPARLSVMAIAFGVLVVGGFASASRAAQTAWRDHAIHRSPNAGWPEGAMAGALMLRLAGPRIYHGEVVEEPFINSAGRDGASAKDIRAALRVFKNACGFLATVTGVAAILALM